MDLGLDPIGLDGFVGQDHHEPITGSQALSNPLFPPGSCSDVVLGIPRFDAVALEESDELVLDELPVFR
jgi:hypothetical protein